MAPYPDDQDRKNALENTPTDSLGSVHPVMVLQQIALRNV